MSDLALPRPAAPADRPEPRTMTLADLAALVVGFALAFALPWRFPFGQPAPYPMTPPQPTWYSALFWTGEVAEKVCLALAVVALARRARHGGPIRPAEFLALACAVPMLMQTAESVPGIGPWVGPTPKSATGPTPIRVHEEGFRVWKRVLTGVFVVAALALVRFRRRLSSGALMGLLGVLIATSMFGLSYHLRIGFDRLTGSAGDGSASFALKFLGALLIELPPALPFGIVGAAALFDPRRRSAPGWNWVEYAAAVLASFLLLSLVVTTLCRLFWETPNGYAFATLLTLPAIWAGLSLLAARRLGPAWRRWLAPSPAAS